MELVKKSIKKNVYNKINNEQSANNKMKNKKDVTKIINICFVVSLLIITVSLTGIIILKQCNYNKLRIQNENIEEINNQIVKLKDGEESLIKIYDKVNKLTNINKNTKNKIDSMNKNIENINKKIDILEKGA